MRRIDRTNTPISNTFIHHDSCFLKCTKCSNAGKENAMTIAMKLPSASYGAR